MPTISSKLLISFSTFLLFITIFISQTKAQAGFSHYCDNNKGTYTINSTYQNNLNTLLSNITTNTEITYGFYNFSYGQDTNKVYAIGLCHGDVNPHDCRSCLNKSKLFLSQNCPNQTEAIGWTDDHCMLRYSNRSIFNLMETVPSIIISNTNNATDVEAYKEVLAKLLSDLRDKTTNGDSRVKYATENVTGPNFQEKIYGQMQCTPDLSNPKCDECLVGAITDLSSCCANKVGGRVIGPSCNIRYESYLFYERTTAEAPPPPRTTFSSNNNTSPPAPTPGKDNKSRTAIIIAVPTVVIVVLVFYFMCIYIRKKKPEEIIRIPREDDDDGIETIRVATNDFTDSNKLGQGGFGAVYWGQNRQFTT